MRWPLLVVLVGCGRWGFGDAPRGDARLDDSGGGDDVLVVDDAPADAPPPMGPFGAPAAVPGIGAADDPTLTGDLLEVFFDSGRAGGLGGGDIWTARRATTSDTWGTATNVTILNSAGDDATPEVTRDGLMLYFVTAGPSGMKDIYYATRADRMSAWSAKVHVPELSTAADESGITVTPDHLTLYFSSNPSGDDDIYVSTRPTTSSAWGTPVLLSTNSTSAGDGEPFVNGANTLLLWSSDRSGQADLWMSRRAQPQDAWGTPQPMTELNTTGNAEGDPWLSPDERVIMFSRNSAIFTATR